MYVVFLVGAGGGAALEDETNLIMANVESTRATDKMPIMARRKYFVLSLLGLGLPQFLQKEKSLLFSVPHELHLQILFSSLYVFFILSGLYMRAEAL